MHWILSVKVLSSSSQLWFFFSCDIFWTKKNIGSIGMAMFLFFSVSSFISCQHPCNTEQFQKTCEWSPIIPQFLQQSGGTQSSSGESRALKNHIFVFQSNSLHRLLLMPLWLFTHTFSQVLSSIIKFSSSSYFSFILKVFPVMLASNILLMQDMILGWQMFLCLICS